MATLSSQANIDADEHDSNFGVKKVELFLQNGSSLVQAQGTSGGNLIMSPPTSATGTVTRVASSASSVTLLASNASRKGAAFFNESTQILYVKFGTTASSTDYTLQLFPNAYYEIPTTTVYTGRIDGIWASANGACQVTEL